MFRLLSAVCVLALFCKGQVDAFAYIGDSEEVLAECRAAYNEKFESDFLLGEWFEVMNFLSLGSYVPSHTCVNHVFSKATEANIIDFGNKHGVTLSMEDDPMLCATYNGEFINLFSGSTQAKEYYSDYRFQTSIRNLYNFKKLSENFVLQWNCSLRGNSLWLLSRTPQPTDAEIEAAIAGVPEVERKHKTRYCAY